MSRTTKTSEEEQLTKLNSSFEYTAELSRRNALKAVLSMAGAAVLFGFPHLAQAADATEATKKALAEAQAKYEQVQKQMNELAAQFQELSVKQDQTLSQIEAVQNQIDATQLEIEKKEAELKAKKGILSDRVSSNYKAGGTDALAMLLSSSSFDELISKTFYLNKVNESDQEAIAAVNRVQRELEQQKLNLEKQKSELEALRAVQAEQLKAMNAKKDEVQNLLSNLSDDVKALIAQRDKEILAAAKAEEEARRAAAAARQHANGVRGSAGVRPGMSQTVAGATAQKRVVNSCGVTPSPGYGLCAAWVSYVFENAGLGYVGGNANDMYNAWCTSSDKNKLKVGMIIAVSSHPQTQAGQVYGHVGVYVGGNTVMDNIGYIRSINLDQWINFYGETVTPRWGWASGINLEA
ncbi:twin-arginine translocation signal domain-containing protein [Collinsella sp. zg1085]|uniref:coiled-coil domain-containing protein n=1 Tax=Collinsella sp. zg1085 TaxID=2844380 RepID=UPI001C0D5989|nr:CHAP domain-containing protein [Collinsella sp. zg1085]QWT17736.1 twin-arginine translocation signal domain-containing protein [Collinsella sp. zg1085]